MARIKWPRNVAPVVATLQPDHPNVIRVANQIIDHARAGRRALTAGTMSEAKYHRDCCGLLLWRLSVDGLTADGQLRFNAAKYETRLVGRLSTPEARAIRDSPRFTRKAQSSLMNKLACDHIVPRNCVADVLVSPYWLDLDDLALAHAFVVSHAEVALLSPKENSLLSRAKLQSNMPTVWWDAPIDGKLEHRLARYEAVGITVARWAPDGQEGSGSSGTPLADAVTGKQCQARRTAASLPPESEGVPEKWIDPRASLAVILAMEERHGLSNALFQRIHHGGPKSSLSGHKAYCKKTVRFTTDTNPRLGKRLECCLAHLDKGRSWEDSIEGALAEWPLGMEQP